MRGVRRSAAALCAAALVLGLPQSAAAQSDCPHVVVFTLPGITWSDVRQTAPPHLLGVARDGAVGAVSVRTISARTSHASGFATLGAGARVDGGRVAGGPAAGTRGRRAGPLESGTGVGGLSELEELARRGGYGAVPGALGSAVGERPLAAIGNADPGKPPPLPAGLDRWPLLAAMDARGRVDLSATTGALLRRSSSAPYGVRTDPGAIRRAVDAALLRPCSVLVIDQGDVTRADADAVGRATRSREAVHTALRGADSLVGYVRASLDPARDLLVVVSPTSPWAAPQAHLGVAMALGPGFPPGSALESASTRRRGIVTLPDVAPTVLAHVGAARPAAMNGRPWFAEPAAGDRIRSAIELDRESVFVDRYKSSIAAGFVVYQLLVYLVAVPLIAKRERDPDPGGFGRWPVLAALAVVAFPVSTYLAGIVAAHTIGLAGLVGLLVGLDVALVAAVSLLRDPLDRLLALAAFTTAVLVADLFLGAHLQLNTVFGYSPIVAGRFAGTGNTGFAFLGAAGLITGALIVHRWPGRRAALVLTAALFAGIVIVDGAPQVGSDVGGILALVPALGITWVLLSGRRPTLRTLAVSVAASLLAVAVFTAVDLARPPEARTHLARLWEDVSRRGGGVLLQTIERKASSNLRVFRSTIYTFFVPPALGVMAWLLRRPRGRWERLARTYPRLRAGLVGGLILGVLGFAVNDSGIAIPAVILSYLLPMALLVHLVMAQEHGGAPPPAPDRAGAPR